MSMPGACPTCASPLSAGDKFCGACGRGIPAGSALATADMKPDAGRDGGAGRARATPQGSRFLPGVILADRYRIVGPLGRGGMGEVYRADDLKLGQPVALKFLPPGFEDNPESLRRFLNEVRTARQVSHANVCRIHDAGEADGQHFLSMEYVDGEDLASLLRRIGYLPKDKAIQIARQLCAGLAAAHEIGVLHRDLKPANIMIDGRGRARITDFGLAAFAGQVDGREILAGTPAYMAPEQIAGHAVSVRSDLYSLGLVLYELFTGKPAFAPPPVTGLRRLRSESTPAPPSSLVEGFDPSVERVILRCLEADPSRRPASALGIAAALPGGDPLAAALAAGETPSPEMVAEADDAGAVPPALSWGVLAFFLTGLAGIVALSPRATLVGMVPLEKPPEVLEERAREILRLAGRDGTPADSLFAFQANEPYLRSLTRGDGAGAGAALADRLASSPPAGILFWYRESPKPLTPLSGASIGTWLADPPDTTPGMARVGLDPEGRLNALLIVPPETIGTEPAETDWMPLLSATGVDTKSLSPVAPELTPPVYADRRAAWTSSWPGRPEIPLRIEGAAARGRPVSLRIVEPWERPSEVPAPRDGIGRQASRLLHAVWPLVVMLVAAVAALRNVRRGRGDRRGALRLALYLGAARMALFLGAHHVASPDETELFMEHLAFSMLEVGLGYVFYLALEPYARRLWPRMLTTWVRVLEGRLRDPLVGRDLLIGSAAGVLNILVVRLIDAATARLGGAPGMPPSTPWTFEPLRGTIPTLVTLAGIHGARLVEILFPLTTILIFRLLLRRTGLAVLAASVVGIVLFYPDTGSVPAYLLKMICFVVIMWPLLFRVGLLAFATLFMVTALSQQLPLTPHPPGWLFGMTFLSLACIAAPALYGFWIARAGRPLFADDLLEDAARR